MKWWRFAVPIAAALLSTTVSASPASAADHRAPSASFISPGSSAVVRGTVTVKAKISDRSGVRKAELLVNGRRVGTDYRAPFALRAKLAGKNGSVKLQWRVWDRHGNHKVITRYVYADSTRPSLTLIAPASGSVVISPTVITARASDRYGISWVEFSSNGERTLVDRTAPYTFNFDPRPLGGIKTITVRAYDRAGNVATRALTYPTAPSFVAPTVGAPTLVSCDKEGTFVTATYEVVLLGGRYSLYGGAGTIIDIGWNGGPSTLKASGSVVYEIGWGGATVYIWEVSVGDPGSTEAVHSVYPGESFEIDDSCQRVN